MQGVSFWFLTTGIGYVLFGMAYGVHMSITGDFSTAGAHGHLNLIGFVISAIYAFYYHHFAKVAGGLRWAHFWLHQVAVVGMFVGIILAVTEGSELVVKVSSMLALASMVVFAYIHVVVARRA